jgi:hypothetical protein
VLPTLNGAVDLGPIRAAITYRRIARLGPQFGHQNDAGDELRRKLDRIPSTGVVTFSAKRLAKLDLSLHRCGCGQQKLG